MERIEKTLFISYRRTNFAWALAVFQNLTQHGYDVFFDYNGIASGDFESVILQNIKARAHFLVLLTPSALKRCDDPSDWLRREIETALANQRNTVPLMLEGFDFDTPTIARQLTGALAALKHYNGLRIPPDFFEEAMERLRSRYLNVMLDHDTRRVYRLFDFTKRLRLAPGCAYCVAGKVNSVNTLYLVIESVKRDTKHGQLSTTPVPADGAGGYGMR